MMNQDNDDAWGWQGTCNKIKRSADKQIEWADGTNTDYDTCLLYFSGENQESNLKTHPINSTVAIQPTTNIWVIIGVYEIDRILWFLY